MGAGVGLAAGADPPAVRDKTRRPVKDCAPVSPVATLPAMLLVNPSVPARAVRELIALARKKPGKIDFGSAGY